MLRMMWFHRIRTRRPFVNCPSFTSIRSSLAAIIDAKALFMRFERVSCFILCRFFPFVIAGDYPPNRNNHP
jgi:hypothetical protein